MHPDLMGASGFQPKREQSVFPIIFQCFPMGDSRHRIYSFHAGTPSDTASRFQTDGKANYTFPFQDSLTHRLIFFLNFLGQNGSGISIFCQQKHAGGIPVQTI